MCRSELTAGRVDGAGGRGSYEGLRGALSAVLDVVRDRLGAPLALLDLSHPNLSLYIKPIVEGDDVPDGGEQGEALSEPGAKETSDMRKDVDVLVFGIWRPVIAVLTERFPGMVSAAVPAVFHRCYSELEYFALSLGRMVAQEVVSGWAQQRVLGHPAVKQFNQTWALEMYIQVGSTLERLLYISCINPVTVSVSLSFLFLSFLKLRAQEINDRLTYVFHQAKTQGVDYDPFASLYTRSGDGPTASLSPSEALDIKLLLESTTAEGSTVATLRCGPVIAVAVEVCTCFHPSVFLSPLRARFVALAMQVGQRLGTCFSEWSQVDQSQSPGSSSATVASPSPSAVPTVDPPGPGSSAKVPTVPLPSSTSGSARPLGISDLIALMVDMKVLVTLTSRALLDYALKTCSSSSGALGSDVVPVEESLGRSVVEWSDAVVHLWDRCVVLLEADCKAVLSSVRGVAGKYRMTNKPPPDTGSPYVTNILVPLRCAGTLADLRPLHSH